MLYEGGRGGERELNCKVLIDFALCLITNILLKWVSDVFDDKREEYKNVSLKRERERGRLSENMITMWNVLSSYNNDDLSIFNICFAFSPFSPFFFIRSDAFSFQNVPKSERFIESINHWIFQQNPKKRPHFLIFLSLSLFLMFFLKQKWK